MTIAQVIKTEQHPKGYSGFLKYYAPDGVPKVDLVFYTPRGVVLWEAETGLVRTITREQARNRIARTLP